MRNPCTLSCSDPRALIMMIGIVAPSDRSASVILQPSSPGSMRSITATSGRSNRSLRNAASPLSAHSTSMPAPRR